MLSREILVPLYILGVRRILDYGVQVWSPHLVRDIQFLERIQRRAVKLVPEIKWLPYEERYHYLGLQTLRDRRVRGDDIILIFTLVHSSDDVPCTRFFRRNTNNLKGHSHKMSKPDHWQTILKGS